jgi:acetyltransferase
MSVDATPEWTFTLPDGRQIVFRPVTPHDQPLIADAISTASRRTLLHRFFIPLRGLAPEELRKMLTIDPARDFCIVGELRGPAPRIVCGARYVRLVDPAIAEIALTVHDDFQRHGIGRHLLRLLIEQGRVDGIRTFVADVLATNTPMLHLLQTVAPNRRSIYSSGVSHVEWDL